MKKKQLLLISAAIIVGLLTTPTLAADNGAVTGTWSVTMSFQGNQVDVTLMITEEDGSLGGTWTTRRGESTLSNVAWDGETLTFQRKIERQGMEFELDHTATIDGDKMTGKMTTPRGENEFSGERV